ncbi:MaoC family dehydratase N-terminal domain-containing protein, partial [Streptomyces sp. AC563]
SISYRAAHQVIHDPQLGLDYNRVVHGDQAFSYVRPVRAGDCLSVTSTIESVRTMAGNDILVVRGDVHDKSGELVVTARTMLVARGADGK